MTNRIKPDELVRRIVDRDIGRRDVTRILAGAGLTSVLMPLLPRGGAAADVNLRVFDWTGYEDPSLHPEFTAKYGAEPEFALFGDEEEALTKMRSGFNVDVSHPCTANIQRWRDAGVIRAIDTSRVPRWNNILPQLLGMNGFIKDGETWAMPWDWGYSVIGYNPELMPSDNPTFSLMTDPAAEGKVAMNSQFDVAIAVAGVIGGFTDPFDPTEEEIARLPEIWDTLLGNSRILWTDRTEVEQAFASGEVAIGYLWSDSINSLRAEGIPIEIVQPSLAWACGYALNTNAPGSEEQAYEFLDALLDPAAGKVLIEWGYGHSNRESFDLADPAAVDALGMGDIDAFFANSRFFDVVNKDNRDRLIAMWSEAQARQ
jgi:putative spermidine/putrescine transport system substrate-binding protein/spermidine/putrescine transport system substrate-binding protein